MKIASIRTSPAKALQTLALALLLLHSLKANSHWTAEYIATGLGRHSCTNCELNGYFDGYYRETLPLDYEPYYPLDWDDFGEPILNPWWIAGNVKNSIHASANNGVLKTYVASSYSQPEYYGDGSMMSLGGAFTKASARDSLIVERKGSQGTSGTVIFLLDLDWVVERSERSDGRVWAGISTFNASNGELRSSDHIWTKDSYWIGGAKTFRGTYKNIDGQHLSEQSESLGTSSVKGLYKFSAPIVYGERFGFEYNLSASAGGVFSDPFEIKIRANHSAAWGGVVAFLDEGGSEIFDANIVSESGFDWSRSYITQVPENPSWGLLVLGLFFAAISKKRARSALGQKCLGRPQFRNRN